MPPKARERKLNIFEQFDLLQLSPILTKVDSNGQKKKLGKNVNFFSLIERKISFRRH